MPHVLTQLRQHLSVNHGIEMKRENKIVTNDEDMIPARQQVYLSGKNLYQQIPWMSIIENSKESKESLGP